MFTNKKFGVYAACLCMTGLLYMFLIAALQTGQTQLLARFITPEAGGWSRRALFLPVAAGYILSVPVLFLCARAMARSGVRRALIPGTALAAAGCAALMAANGLDVYGGARAGLYGLYVLAQALLCCGCVCARAGVFFLCAAWFLRYRGRVLGFVTMGGPICAALGADWAGDQIAARLAGDCRPVWAVATGLLALLMLAVRFLLRDEPEDTGLYPDGADRLAEEPPEEEPLLPPGRLLAQGRFWLLLLAFGAMTGSAAGCLGGAQARLAALGAGQGTGLSAARWFSLGAIFAIPVSYGAGYLADQWGPERTCAAYGAAALIGPAALWAMPAGGSTALLLAWSLGTAVMLGGLSTLLPAALAHVYGRRQMLAAGQLLLPLWAIPAAILPAVAASGQSSGVWAALFILGAAGALASLGLLAVRPGKAPPEPGGQAPSD